MDKVYEEIIRKNFEDLCNKLDVKLIYARLIQEKVINTQQYEHIESAFTTKSDKAMELLLVVIRRGKEGYDAFVRAIQHNHQNLFELLLGEMKRKNLPTDYLYGWSFSMFHVFRMLQMDSIIDPMEKRVPLKMLEKFAMAQKRVSENAQMEIVRLEGSTQFLNGSVFSLLK